LGDTYNVRVARGSSLIDYSLVMTARPNWQKLWLVQVPLLIISWVFSATGLGVGLIAARDRVARLYAIAALLIGAVLIPNGVFIGDALHGRSRAALSTAAAFTAFVFPLIYHFLMEFPPGIAPTLVWSRVTIFLYAWGTAPFPLTIVVHPMRGRRRSAVDSDHDQAQQSCCEHPTRRSFEPPITFP
jgi:hypothetical protein